MSEDLLLDDRNAARFKEINSYEIIETPREGDYDEIVQIASEVCETPIAIISFVAETKQWFKAEVGLGIRETSLEVSFCKHAILQTELFIVEDATKDPRFMNNSLVTGPTHIRSYAGAVLKTSSGPPIGTLCVLDRRPRVFSTKEKSTLKNLARQVMVQLELRRLLKATMEREEALRISELRYRRLFESAQDGILIINGGTGIIEDINPFLLNLLGYNRNHVIGRTIAELSLFKDIESNELMLKRLQTEGYVRYDHLPLVTADGKSLGVEFVSNLYLTGDKPTIQCNIRDVTEKKKLEKRFQLLDSCVSHFNDIVIITEAQTLEASIKAGEYNIVFVNQAFETITGYSQAEALGRNPGFLEGEKTDPTILMEIREALAKHHPIRRQVINYRKDHTEYWVDVNIVPIFDDTGQCTHFAALERDITNAKKAEISLNLFRTLMDRSPDAIEVIDAKSGKFVDVNETACQRLGYSREEMLALSILDVVPGGIPFSMKDHLAELRQKGFKVIEGRHRRKNGTSFPSEVNVQYLNLDQEYLVAIVRDITDRKEVENQLVWKSAFFEAQAHSSVDGILIVDSEGKKVLQNQRMIDLWNIPLHIANEVEDRNQLQWVVQQVKDPQQFTDRVAHHYANPELVSQDELELKDGKVFDRYSAPVRGKDGTYFGRIWSFRDVTRSKQTEVSLHQALDKAESANRAKSEFLAVMSHEIRTPMNGVLGFATLLQNTPLNAEQKEYVETISNSGESLLVIINDILDFTKIEAGKYELEQHPFELIQCIDETVSLCTSSKNKKVDVQVLIDPKTPTWVLGDVSRIRQILVNLLGNALKFTEEGFVKLQVQPSEGSSEMASFIRFDVSDTGIGIPLDKLEQLFKPFNQIDSSRTRKFGGTGLGLAISKKLIEIMGGEVWVESQPGSGTTFSFKLPLKQVPQPTNEVSKKDVGGLLDRAVDAPPAELLKILVVEDVPVNRILALKMLAGLGYKADSVANGLECLQLLKIKSYDVIFMDIQMPEMDGIAATERIRQGDEILFNKPLYICALTANVFEKDVEKYYAAGMNDVISKPLRPENLKEALYRAHYFLEG